MANAGLSAGQLATSGAKSLSIWTSALSPLGSRPCSLAPQTAQGATRWRELRRAQQRGQRAETGRVTRQRGGPRDSGTTSEVCHFSVFTVSKLPMHTTSLGSVYNDVLRGHLQAGLGLGQAGACLIAGFQESHKEGRSVSHAEKLRFQQKIPEA